MTVSNTSPINWNALRNAVISGHARLLARAISLVENEVPGYIDLFAHAAVSTSARLIGITGPPGAGKSTLVDALIGQWVAEGKKIAVLCVDPSSPFHQGALLGDRIRMSKWYNHPRVFIRSLSSRGTLGGLHPKIIEIADLLRLAAFDLIVVETVGVGQNEVAVTALADMTLVVLVPGSGDEVQIMKAGLLEVADVFVLNKADQPDADKFAHWLQSMQAFGNEENSPPVLKTIATEKKGIAELAEQIEIKLKAAENPDRLIRRLTEKACLLIAHRLRAGIDKNELENYISKHWQESGFNLYSLCLNWPGAR